MYQKRLTRFLKPVFISVFWPNHKRYLKIDTTSAIAPFVLYNFLIMHFFDLETPSTPKLEFFGLRLMKTRFFGTLFSEARIPWHWCPPQAPTHPPTYPASPTPQPQHPPPTPTPTHRPPTHPSEPPGQTSKVICPRFVAFVLAPIPPCRTVVGDLASLRPNCSKCPIWPLHFEN